MRPGEWVDEALCAKSEYRSLNWFPEKTGRHNKRELARDKAQLVLICDACPVQAECRGYAEKIHATLGIWGGRNYYHRFSVKG